VEPVWKRKNCVSSKEQGRGNNSQPHLACKQVAEKTTKNHARRKREKQQSTGAAICA